MKNSLGNPQFIVRLNEREETTLIALAKDFQKDSYAKTIVAVAMNYESDKRRLVENELGLRKRIKELETSLNASEKENKSIRSKIDKFVGLVDKVADIKKELSGFRPGKSRPQK